LLKNVLSILKILFSFFNSLNFISVISSPSNNVLYFASSKGLSKKNLILPSLRTR
jgi:hypothetical protein